MLFRSARATATGGRSLSAACALMVFADGSSCGHQSTGVGRFPIWPAGQRPCHARDPPLLPTCITMHRRSPAKSPQLARSARVDDMRHSGLRLIVRQGSDALLTLAGLLIKVMQQTCPRILADYLRTAEPQTPSDLRKRADSDVEAELHHVACQPEPLCRTAAYVDVRRDTWWRETRKRAKQAAQAWSLTGGSGSRSPSRRLNDRPGYFVLLKRSSTNVGSGVPGGRSGFTATLNQASC